MSSNDKIEFTTALSFYTQAMPDNPDRQAVFYGPVLLAGVLGNKEPASLDVPVFISSKPDVNNWIKKANNTSLLSFETMNASTSGSVKLIPFNTTEDEYYTLYWDVFTPENWAVQQKKYEAAKQKQKELDARTLDNLRIGEMQPERDHELVAEKSVPGDEHNKKWRLAADSGFITFNMKVDSSLFNTLVCTYWGMDNRGRVFDIFVNDTMVATEDLNNYKESKFYDIAYAIPKAIPKDKRMVKIKIADASQLSALLSAEEYNGLVGA